MNRTFAAQVSDRRISRNGVAMDEESNKAIVLVCRDSRFLVGYSGLAEYEGFRTKEWLLNVLFEVAPPDFTAKGMAERFIERATHDFARLPSLQGLDPRRRRLTVMWTGFVTNSEQPRGAALLVSNFQQFENETWGQAQDTFNCMRFIEREGLQGPMTWVQRIGQWKKFPDAGGEELRRLLRESKPRHAPVEMAVDMIRNISVRYPHAGVGRQISSIVLPASRTEAVSTGYHTVGQSHVAYMPSGVIAIGPRNHHAYMEPSLRAVDPSVTPPLVVERVARNVPCPCRSGQKYKRCCGRRSHGKATAA